MGHWLVFCVLTVFSCGAIVSNYAYIVLYFTRNMRSSQIPFVGGLIGGIACALSPIAAIRPFWWLPPILDPGCAFLLIGTLASILINRFRSR